MKQDAALCTGFGGEKCGSPREPGSRWCSEHRRQYQRQYTRRTRQQAKDAVTLARFVHDRNDEEARVLAAKILGEETAEPESSAPPGFQSVLDKYASPE